MYAGILHDFHQTWCIFVIDLHPPTPRAPRGIHSALSEVVAGEEFHPPEGEPLTAGSYEVSRLPVAYMEPLRVGGTLPDRPVFLRPGGRVMLPLGETYTSAYDVVPTRRRRVIEADLPADPGQSPAARLS